MTLTRQQFEKDYWMYKTGKSKHPYRYTTKDNTFKRKPDTDKYSLHETQFAWEMYQMGRIGGILT